ncbi:MAG TPA: ATP-dependent sacrificial sulfur transferase LarE [Sedimentisphaerales bacterium]|nr:ATP-dependent sacrificial sulfur transferase LarE [Sedimentisphaerales bacterium]
MDIEHKHNSLKSILSSLGRVVVAYSGGVDSTFLLKAAVNTLGPTNVLACISVGAVEPKHILERADRLASSFGVRMLRIDADELSDPAFAANSADRCFHCKSHLCQELLDIAAREGFKHVIFGTNLDDLDDFRPGNRAMKHFGIRSPLAEAGLTKQDIRAISRQLGLETADAPASPCLASRLAYGLEITRDRLSQVEAGEDFLRSLGFVEFRLRHHGDIARIEVPAEDIARLACNPLRSKVVEKLRSIGFKFVSLDMSGFRSGSMNDQLSDEQKQKFSSR